MSAFSNLWDRFHFSICRVIYLKDVTCAQSFGGVSSSTIKYFYKIDRLANIVSLSLSLFVSGLFSVYSIEIFAPAL